MVAHLQSGRGRRVPQRGFSYLLLLITVAVVGFTAANVVSMGIHASRRDAEYELLTVGAEFEHALASYRVASAANPTPGPQILEDLLLDKRTPGVRRHLRKIYVDPLTGRQEWGFVRGPDGSIVGIYSLATGEPIKQSGFGARYSAFKNAKQYKEWVFIANR